MPRKKNNNTTTVTIVPRREKKKEVSPETVMNNTETTIEPSNSTKQSRNTFYKQNNIRPFRKIQNKA